MVYKTLALFWTDIKVYTSSHTVTRSDKPTTLTGPKRAETIGKQPNDANSNIDERYLQEALIATLYFKYFEKKVRQSTGEEPLITWRKCFRVIGFLCSLIAKKMSELNLTREPDKTNNWRYGTNHLTGKTDWCFQFISKHYDEVPIPAATIGRLAYRTYRSGATPFIN